jgi:hypothetical protein
MGASAVYSSAHDLVRFGMFHLKNRLSEQGAILKDATLDLMHVAIPPAAYGLGWAVGQDMGIPRLSHTGGMPGVATALNLYPTENMVVTVLSSTGFPTGMIAQDIAAVLVPKYADSLRARRAFQAQQAGGGRGAPPPSQLNAITGEWSGSLRVEDDGSPATEHSTRWRGVGVARQSGTRGRESGGIPQQSSVRPIRGTNSDRRCRPLAAHNLTRLAAR